MQGIIAPLIDRYPDEHDQGNFGVVVRSLRDDLLGESRRPLMVLSGAALLVLLLACSNVANLMLARGASRRRELAVRTALGAGRFRLIRQLLTESCILALGGAAAGLLVAYACQRAVIAFGASALPRLDRLALDGPVLAFAAVLGVFTGLVFGVIPAIESSGGASDRFLKDSPRGGTEGGRARLRRTLVVCQVTAAMILVIAAGLLTKSFDRLTRVPSGFNPDRVLTMRVTLPASRYPDRPEVTAFFARLLDRVRVLPGIRSAGAGTGLPLALASGDWSFDIEGRPRIGTRYPGAADWYVVTPGYFESLSIPLKRGRLPQESDDAAGTHVVFINEATARALFSGEDPLGRRIRLSRGSGAEQPWRTIAGIVGDVRFRGLDTPPRPELFIPYDQYVHFSPGVQARSMTMVVKAESEPMRMLPLVRAELRAVDPEVPPAQQRDMATVVGQSVADRRLNLFLIGGFGALALTLATVGLYGVMAYNVSQRTREMGVRLAVGASRQSVLSLVVLEGMRMVVIGAVTGVAGALAFGSTLAALLFEVHPRDAGVLVTAPAVLLAAGTAASYIPARRATRVDPVVALRAD
jgi:putative ABC transport system permease protein